MPSSSSQTKWPFDCQQQDQAESQFPKSHQDEVLYLNRRTRMLLFEYENFINKQNGLEELTAFIS